MDTKAQQFLARIPPNGPAHLASDITVAFGIPRNFQAKAAAIRSDGKLTPAGQDDAIAKALMSGPLAHLQQLRDDVERRLGLAVAQRAVLRKRVLEADNFPESRKLEVRTWLRSLSDAERMKVVLKADDPLISEAVLNAAHYLSGLTQQVWAAAADRAVEAAYGVHLREIDTLETAYLEARAATEVAAMDLQRVAGLDEHEFAKLAA